MFCEYLFGVDDSVNSFDDTGTGGVFRGNVDSPNYKNCFDDRIASKQNIFDLFGGFPKELAGR